MLTDPTTTPAEHGGAAMVELSPETMGAVVNRLRRAQGQIGGVLRMIEEGRNCQDIVTQLAAVSRALDRAGFAVIAAGLKQCLLESDGQETLDTKTVEKLFLSLA
jgi:DNA-binding FrmR family transcriptional regulator